MKVYVAASSSEMERAKNAIAMLTAIGIECTSRWVATIERVGDANPAEATREDRVQWAQDNLDDIERSDAVWMLAPSPGVMSHGAFFELGFAIALRNNRAFLEGVLTPRIVASGGDHRWVFLALADFVEPNDAMGLDAVVELFHEEARTLAANRGDFPVSPDVAECGCSEFGSCKKHDYLRDVR